MWPLARSKTPQWNSYELKAQQGIQNCRRVRFRCMRVRVAQGKHAVVHMSAEIDGLRSKSHLRRTTERTGITPMWEVRIWCTFAKLHQVCIHWACSLQYQTDEMCIYIIYRPLSPLETGICDCEKQVMLQSRSTKPSLTYITPFACSQA